MISPRTEFPTAWDARRSRRPHLWLDATYRCRSRLIEGAVHPVSGDHAAHAHNPRRMGSGAALHAPRNRRARHRQSMCEGACRGHLIKPWPLRGLALRHHAVELYRGGRQHVIATPLFPPETRETRFCGIRVPGEAKSMPTCLDRADPTPCPGFQPKQCRVHVPHGSPRRRSAWHTSRATALHLARHRLVCRASARARSMIRPRALGSLVTAVNTIASATIAATAQAERIASTHNATVAVAGATPSMSPRAASHTWLPRFMRPGLPLEEDARSRLPIPALPRAGRR